MNTFVIGVDGGGSKTEAVVMDQIGQVLGRGQSISSNHHNVGLEQTKMALQGAMAEALHEAELEINQIQAATWALAGVDRPQERALLLTLATDILPKVSVQVVNDAVAALVGGAGQRYGIVLVAGTGMIAYGENETGDQARAGGWGYLLDQGSAYALGLAALQAIARLADDGEATQLTQALLSLMALTQVSEIITWLYAPQRQVADVAALAPIVLAAAEAGDLIALEMVVQGADALAMVGQQVARRLKLVAAIPTEHPFPFVLSGGLLTSNVFYRQLVVQAVHTKMPQARPILPQRDAAIGAAWLALESLGLIVTLTPLWADMETVFISPDSPTGVKTTLWASEQRNRLTLALDHYPSLTVAGLMSLEDRQAIAAVREILPQIAIAIDHITNYMQQGGRLIYVGAGTSGRLGVLDAAECPPTFNTDPQQVIGLIAGGEKALTQSIEGAEDDPEAGRQALNDIQLRAQDCVVGLAASGRTPYVIGALTEAKRRGTLTLALVCNLPSPIAETADLVLAPLVGSEVLTGSTRLKAGTAQKLVLNMLSTGAMVRLGKTYSNLMVDVQQNNHKLQARAQRIVAQAGEIDLADAATVLSHCDGEVKTAIVKTLLDCSVTEARQRLIEANGVIRVAVQ